MLMIYFFWQGRGIETNLYAQFKCDSLKIGMVMHFTILFFFLLITMKTWALMILIFFFSFLYWYFFSGQTSWGCTISRRASIWLCIQIQWSFKFIRLILLSTNTLHIRSFLVLILQYMPKADAFLKPF
jgi:hypothetical protein